MDKKKVGAITIASVLAFGAVAGEDRKHIEIETDYPQPNALSGVLMIATSTSTATTLGVVFQTGSAGPW